MSDHREYLDVQALAAVTKHTGGYPATRELLEMCHVTAGTEVLEIGCGIGAGAANLARNYGVRVVATDISENAPVGKPAGRPRRCRRQSAVTASRRAGLAL